MVYTEVEVEQQLKEVGKQLSHPSDSIDELLTVLDKVEKLLLKVDQCPKKSMVEALKPSMNALIQDSLLKHSDIDVKVAVATCISEITRITAPDAPYTDDQMRDVFQLIVSSFEDLADQSSRSYNKRASILETVSKVRSCVIMLDLECDELIVKMFEHFLKSVRDYHLDSIFSSMENIMVLVIEESEEVSAETLKPLLASVKKDREGVLPVAHKLGKGVLLKSAEKLKPYMRPALTSLGESLDMYHKVVAAICEGTTANFENNDDNDSGLKLANECKLEKGSVDEAQQADDSKLTTASSDHMNQGVKKEACPEEVVDPTVENRSPKPVMSNGVNVTVKEEVAVNQESIKLKEDKSQEPMTKEDTDESDADKLAKEKPQTKNTSEQSVKEADANINSVEPSDSSHVEGDKEIEKSNDVKELENENEKDHDVKDSENQNEKDSDVKESENEAVIPSETVKDTKTVLKFSPKAEESKPAAAAIVSSPSQNNSVADESSVRSKKKMVPQEDETASAFKSRPPPDETRVKKMGLPEKKDLPQEDRPEAQKQAGKKTAIAKEVKLADTVNKSEDNEASSDSDEKPLKKSESKSKSTKQSKSKQSGKKLDASESDAKKPKQSGKIVDVKGEESDSDAKPLKMSVKKGEKSKIVVEEDDSDNKPLKPAKKSTSKKKEDDKKHGNDKNVAGKDQAKSQAGNDKNVSSAKRKRSTGKNKVIKYDETLVGTKIKVWWPEDSAFYEGVVTEFYPAIKKHKVSYVDGDQEKLNLRTQKWEILQKFSVRNDEDQNTVAQLEEESPEIPKKKKSKTDPAASQEKIKDSAKRVGGASSSSKSKGSTPKDSKSTQKTSSKSCDTAATTSKEAEKSKEDEETLKTSSKTKTVNKSKGKTPPSGSKSDTNGPLKGKSGSSNVKEPEDAKSTENKKGESKSSEKKRKKTT